MLFNIEDINKAKGEIDNKYGMFDKMMEIAGITDYDERNKKCRCPWHDENTPSLIYNPKSENYSAHCFGACQRNYDILDVIMLVRGCSYAQAVKELFEIADMPYSFGELGVKSLRNYRYPKEVVCKDKTKVYEYLALRKISKETADYLDIRQDENGNVVFNYYDLNDVLTMVKYRPSRRIVKGSGIPKNWCQKGADTRPILFNMNRINPTQPVLICSGELDCAAAIEAGWKNSVSIPLGDGNDHFIEETWDWLETLEHIIVAADNDESGRKFLNNVVPRLGGWRTKIMQIPEDCKDVNEVLYKHGKEKVLDLIVNAKDTPVPSVSDFSDVKAVDFSDMEGVKTGITELDKQLIKLPYGTLTVISGLPGSGKSSLVSQIICNSVDEGKPIWLYSGELSNPISKSWVNYVLAGRRNVEPFVSQGDTYYCVNMNAIEQINERYRGLWYVYKDDYRNDIDSLIESATDSIRKYGVKTVILDNMMVISNSETDNELKDQTNIVKKLVALAQKYSVAVILVAHPRKLAAGTDVGLNDISGTQNISNIAHRTIALRRITENEKDGTDKTSMLKDAFKKYDVTISVIKDRMRGKSGITIGEYFDPISRRFFSTQEEFDRQYSWDKSQYREPMISDKLLNESNEDEVFGEV